MDGLPESFADGAEKTAFVLLCVAALCFPFSVAACNIALAGSLLAGLIGGHYLAGLRLVWQRHRSLCIAWLAYLSLFPIGLLWSLDAERGMQIIGRQWFWLLTPLVAYLLRDQSRRHAFLMVFSLGLILHLLFCLAQYNGLVELVNKAGSTADNPTGFIGHTSFGLVYGIWAALLMHWSMFMQGWPRWLARLFALAGVGMIFLSSGRGGYLVLAVLLMVMLWKLIKASTWLKMAAAGLGLAIMVAGLSIGPGKARMLESWHSIQAMEHGNFKNPEARFSMWYTAIQAWEQHAPMGVGTGGFHVASAGIMAQRPDLFFGGIPPSHPHNMLLQSLTRWGPAGVLLLGALFVIWIREGWRRDWDTGPTAGLIALTGIALFVQGLTEPSFEEHFPGVLAAMLLGTGLAATGVSGRQTERAA